STRSATTWAWTTIRFTPSKMTMTEAAETSIPLLHIENASVVRAERRILDDVSLTLAAGEHTAILGRNGSGKSTLVKLILHQLYPVHGARVEVFGQSPWDVF